MPHKTKRPEPKFTMREIAEAWIDADYPAFLRGERTSFVAFDLALRRIARARKRKKK